MPRSALLSLLARSALLRSSQASASSACAASSTSVPSFVAAHGAWNGAARALASRSSTTASQLSSRSSTTASHLSSSAAISTSTPSSSPSSNNYSDHLHLGDAAGQAHINALLYRARQRGFLELDLLLGGWATRNASKLDAQGRAALEELLGLENPDLFAWLTGQVPAPADVAENVAFQSIAADVAERLHKHRPQEAKSKEGAKWVRGWDDIKKEGGGGGGGGGKKEDE